MTLRGARLTLVLAFVAAAAGCTFEDPCEFGTCLTGDAGTTDAGAAGDADFNPQNVASNAGNVVPNAGNVAPNADNAQTNNSAPDAGNNLAGDAGSADSGGSDSDTSPVCEVDIFDFTCAADQYEVNDTFPENLATIGCTRDGDLRTFNRTIDARICPLERTDLFDIIMSSCDDQTVTLQISVELENSCPDALWELITPRCNDDDLTCRTSADGRTVTIEQAVGAIGVNTPRFGVRTLDDIFVDYKLRIQSPAP